MINEKKKNKKKYFQQNILKLKSYKSKKANPKFPSF